jgi:hypothetical protein
MDEAGEEESRAARYKLSEEAYNARPDTFRKWVRHLRDAYVHKASSVWMFGTQGVDSSLCSCATYCNGLSILT